MTVGAVHGATGAVGTLLVGLFASRRVNPRGADGLAFGGGFELLGKQALGVGAAALHSLVVTYLLCLLIRRTVGLRVDVDDEARGLDLADHDEVAYEWLLPARGREGSRHVGE